MAKKDKRILKSSLSYKIVTMFVLLTVSVIIVTGTFMINQIDSFYHQEFNVLMQGVFNEDYQNQLAQNAAAEDGYNQIVQSLNAYEGQLGIDSFRNCYILDGKTGKALYGTNPDLAKTLSASQNIIAAMRGRIGNSTTSRASFMDYAVPIKNGDDVAYIIYIKDSKVEVNSVVQSILRIIFMALGLGLLLSVVFGILLSKTIISPISSLTKKAQKISSGDFAYTLDVKSHDELGELTKTFNSMAEELSDMLNQIQSEKDKVETILRYMADGVMAFDAAGTLIHINPAAKKIFKSPRIEKKGFDQIFKEFDLTLTQVLFGGGYQTLERDIQKGNTEIKLFFARFKTGSKVGGVVVVLQDITEQQRLSNARREFVANVSHELRTPLTTIKGYAETMLQSVEDDDYEKSMFETFLNVINNESDRMSRLVRDLLTLSKLDYNQMGLKKEKFDLSLLISDVVDKLKMTARTKQQSLIYEPVKGLDTFLGDRDGMEQVLVNIISNALKYTGPGGTIQISAGKISDNAFVKIRDNGIGIPKEDLPHVFERFYRVDKARSRAQGGTGLGLAISKDIVSAHGGTITIHSDYGAGTEVILMLPFHGEKAGGKLRRETHG